MIFVDTSAWVEYLRDTGSWACEQLDAHLDGELAISDMVRLEVLAGARDDRHLLQLRRLLARARVLPTTSFDHDAAAALYRTCRQHGRTIRALSDCLIAAVAMRHDAPVLHADSDFDALAQVTSIAVVTPSG